MADYPVLGEYYGFVGINTDFIPEELPPKEKPVFIRDANNILIKDGVIKKLRGADYLNSITTQLGRANNRTILAMPVYKKYSTGTSYLMVICPMDIFYLQNDVAWTDIGDIAAGDNDSIVTCADVDDKFVFIVSNDQVVRYWDGSTYSTLTLTAEGVSVLKAKFLLEFKTYLILLNTQEDSTQYRQRIWPSNPGGIQTFDAEDKLDLDVEGEIRAGKKLSSDIAVYFEKFIQRVWWSDADTGFLHEPIVDGIGLYAPKTLTGSEDKHYFLSQKGMMEMVWGGKPESISDGKFNKLILDEIDPVYYYRAFAQYYPHLNHLFLTYPSSGNTYNNVQLIIDVASKELVSKKTLVGDYYSCYGEFAKELSGLDPDLRKQYGMSFIPIIGDKDGYVYEQLINEYQDKNDNYETKIVFPPTFWKDTSKNKRLLQSEWIIEKYADNDITFVIEITNELNEGTNYSFTITGNGNQGIRRYELITDDDGNNLDVFGKDFSVVIKDSSNPYGWDLHGAVFRGYYTGSK